MNISNCETIILSNCPVCQNTSENSYTVIVDSIEYKNTELVYSVDICLACGCMYAKKRTECKELYTPKMDVEKENVHQINEVYSPKKIWNYQNKKLQATELLAIVKKDEVKYLEIGSSDGSFFYVFNKLSEINNISIKGTLVESSGASEKCKNIFDCRVVTESILSVKDIEAKHYDIAVLSHCLEHFDNPGTVLSIVHKALADDGILFIEVPDGMKVDRGITSPLSYFHIVNYNLLTLGELVRRCHFEILDVIERDSYPGLRLIARKKTKGKFHTENRGTLSMSLLWTKSAVRCWKHHKETALKKVHHLLQKLTHDSRLLIYGVGGHTKKMLEQFPGLMNAANCDFTDSNPPRMYKGRLTKDSRHLIFESYDYVIIATYAGQETVYQKLVRMGCPETKIIKLYETINSYAN